MDSVGYSPHRATDTPIRSVATLPIDQVVCTLPARKQEIQGSIRVRIDLNLGRDVPPQFGDVEINR
jgi:hypothetical protein